MNRITTRLLTAALAVGVLAGADALALAPDSGWLPFGAAPAAALQEDPEESEYREARRAISRGEFRRAVELFSELAERFPEGRYVPEANYWQAFSLYRLDAMREALAVLERQLESYPEARITGDARDLALRIRSRLAERGDARSAEAALRQAEAALAGGLYSGAVGAAYATEAALARAGVVSRVALQRAEMAMQRMEASGMGARPGVLGSREAQEGCEEEDVQHAALQALMQIETERALPILRRVLARRDECSGPLRKQAIFVLSQHEPGEAEDIMIEVALNDPEPDVQKAAVFWLSQVGTEKALDALADLLETTDDPELQENALFALSQHGGTRAAGLIRSFALDPSKPVGVRENAIFWMSQHSENQDADVLIELYAQLDSEPLKESVFFGLAQLDDPRAVEWMLERALDDSEATELRKQALFWAGQHGSVDLSRLAGLYGRLSDREMKEQLIFLYSQREEPEAVERLIEVARTETDPELRKRAIFWLGQTGDDRAIEFLVSLVEDPPE
ncbi:MAG: HEAT repeat domain-containing protein [Gemmatimonadota bacterium]|nr:HEAT repeat domain-containing protein [Gemmatimonadota bacterium]